MSMSLLSSPRLLRCLSLSLLFIATLAGPALADNGDPVLPGVWRLSGSDPALPMDDLKPLGKLIGNARVVALGESIHTSGGFYQMKHRLFRYLVEEKGFRVFAFENPWIRADAANQYVQTCQGTPEAAAGLLSVYWQGAEVRDLLQWMCEWNLAHPKEKDRVHFMGFDIQSQTRQNMSALIRFLVQIGVPTTDPLVVGLRRCDGVTQIFYPTVQYPEARYQECKAALDATEALFDLTEPAIVEQTSAEDLAWARLHLVGQQAWQEQIYLYSRNDPQRWYEVRDEGMAYAFQALRELRFPKEKIAIWAHNHHIARHSTEYFDGTTIMGTLLAEQLGEDYVPIALTGHEVWADFSFIYCGPDDPAADNAVERRLHDLGEGYLLVDLDIPPGHTPFFAPGEVVELSHYPMVPGRQLDGIIYLDFSPRMTPLFLPSACSEEGAP
jgi:erythromycin esterase-like protein